MPYLQFDDDQHAVLVEVAPGEVQGRPGVVKAGVAERLSDNLSKAQTTLEGALAGILERTAGAMVRAVKSLEDTPSEIELQFSIKATGELGNLAVGKLSGESNYAVKLTWSKPAPS